MSQEREKTLRRRIDALTAQRDAAIEQMVRTAKRVALPKHCAFCGAPSKSGVCRAHADLL